MTRKLVSLILALCLLFVSTTAVGAQKPQPPQISAAPTVEPSLSELPETVQKAVMLQESLTTAQQTAVRQVLDSYRPEMNAIAQVFMATPKGQVTDLQKLNPMVMKRMKEMVANIEADLNGVLSAEQMAWFHSVLYPEMQQAPQLPSAQIPEIKAPEAAEQTYCFYGAYYDAGGNSYGWMGYLYAYYSFYYYGSNYAFCAYQYAYYGYVYARYALDYSGPTGYSLEYYGIYNNEGDYPYPYYAYVYAYSAYDYFYYAYVYSYYDYYYTGTDYAYYAYAYNSAAYNSVSYSYVYDYYCYYYYTQ
jgi:hypothetical protein